jgi:hypothetical protein
MQIICMLSQWKKTFAPSQMVHALGVCRRELLHRRQRAVFLRKARRQLCT